ncbi:arsenate reductase ArsC [Roseibium sp.]|uniref:arsenate reductase ArsC n=1 Tax=Roseibium sp. TaxID=1936156 RepID=UPI003D107510
MPSEIYNILFLCTRNAARSIIAEAIVNKEGLGRFRAYSAGTKPVKQVRPEVVRLLQRMNYNPEAAYTKSLNDVIQAKPPPFDFVITLCDQAAEKTCPVWPGHPMTALWPVPDPLADDGDTTERETAYADTFRTLNSRLTAFMNLPFGALDELSLRNSLETIGKAH